MCQQHATQMEIMRATCATLVLAAEQDRRSGSRERADSQEQGRRRAIEARERARSRANTAEVVGGTSPGEFVDGHSDTASRVVRPDKESPSQKILPGVVQNPLPEHHSMPPRPATLGKTSLRQSRLCGQDKGETGKGKKTGQVKEEMVVQSTALSSTKKTIFIAGATSPEETAGTPQDEGRGRAAGARARARSRTGLQDEEEDQGQTAVARVQERQAQEMAVLRTELQQLQTLVTAGSSYRKSRSSSSDGSLPRDGDIAEVPQVLPTRPAIPPLATVREQVQVQAKEITPSDTSVAKGRGDSWLQHTKMLAAGVKGR